MRYVWPFLLLTICWLGNHGATLAQTQVNIRKPTNLTTNAGGSPDSTTTRVDNPKSLTFSASTDQRFFFFEDTRNDNGKRVPVSVYGVRAGFLFPTKRRHEAGGLRAAFKTGVGFYFINQTLDRPGLLPNTSEAITRRLRILTGYFEPYLYRKKAIEVSLPMEIGYGHSRYNIATDKSPEGEEARGVFIPAGVGVSASYQFPALFGIRPIHWFGFNILTGYRFILKKDIPESNINYSGLYLSIGPSFYLENLTSDFKYWGQKRKQKKRS